MTCRGISRVAFQVLTFVLGMNPVLALAGMGGWAGSLFVEHQHDFGPVPRGAKVKHEYQLVNRLAEPVTILSLRPSCGCTSGRASASIVQPGQTAVIEALMDTRNFVGHKATVLYVTLVSASGRQEEVGLGVSANILSDIVLNPGVIDFGAVKRGQEASKSLTIERINGSNWRFERMVSASRVIDAQLVETQRSQGLVRYQLNVSLKPAAPAGPLRDEIRLLSNDPETPSIPVMVTALIRGDLTAAPSILSLGKVDSVAGVQGRFLVRGSKPFAIRSIEGVGDGFSVSSLDGSRKTFHIITVTYRPEAGTTRGDVRRVFRVHTDLPDEPPVNVTATLRDVP